MASGGNRSTSLSRASSTGSLHSSGTNPRLFHSMSNQGENNRAIGNGDQSSDEVDSDGELMSSMQSGANGYGGDASLSSNQKSQGGPNLSYKERRREAHTQAEQKRRDAIKKGYDYLQDLVPNCSPGETGSGHKVSKAMVLQKSIDYIQQVQQEKKNNEEELSLLRKEVIALQIMRANYEQLVKAHQAQPLNEDAFVPSDIKFQTFQMLMDSLFQSFNDSVSMNNFSELSGCVFSWLEDQGKPQYLQDLMEKVLQQVRLNYEVKNGGVPTVKPKDGPHQLSRMHQLAEVAAATSSLHGAQQLNQSGLPEGISMPVGGLQFQVNDPRLGPENYSLKEEK